MSFIYTEKSVSVCLVVLYTFNTIEPTSTKLGTMVENRSEEVPDA
jgi:hypothetical protein